ncbi:MAG: HEPN domain-containing protein [Thermoproteales archaeon]|nr:HEPN domain-containing protein [Thermoproteales archaeon]
MSNLDFDEFNRWIRSAEKTLESTIADLEYRNYSWVCFKSHQAAEKSLKALLWGTGNPKIGHSLVSLLTYIKEMGIDIPKKIFEICSILSKYYMITRYPDTWESGIPEDYFTEKEAREALKYTEELIEWVRETWEKLSKYEK